jgi:hypothetical protein
VMKAMAPATYARILRHFFNAHPRLWLEPHAALIHNDDLHRSKKHSSRRVMVLVWYRNWYTYERPVNNQAGCQVLQQSRIPGRLGWFW